MSIGSLNHIHPPKYTLKIHHGYEIGLANTHTIRVFSTNTLPQVMLQEFNPSINTQKNETLNHQVKSTFKCLT